VTDLRDDLREAYMASVLDLALPGPITVTPRPPGVIEGEFPADIGHLHVITASNPHSRPLHAEENDARNELLRRELRDRPEVAAILPATGRSATGGWSEDGFAVIDVDRDVVLDLATRHGQSAVYEWMATHLAVVWTAPQRADDRLGWAITPRG